MGMESSWAGQVGEEISLHICDTGSCRVCLHSSGLLCPERSEEHRALPGEKCQIGFHGLLQRDCSRGLFL